MDLSALIHLAGRMNQDQFLLKWNNHQNNFVEVFSYLRTQDAFVDVTLACDGKSFSAHKVVLSACSPYFQTLFQTNPCKHPIVFLKDVKGQELEALIEFIYKGEVSVSQSELGSLISTAENLKIKGLAEPDRPTEKAVKRIASPPRSQPPTLVSQATTVGTPITVTQHLQVKYPQSSPVAKRKKTEQFNVQSSYVGLRENQEEVVTVETENGENLSLRGENLSLRGENLTIRDHPPQVVLVPSHEVSSHQQEVTTHTPQPYASHHAPIPASESVLYSVSGTAIYAGTAQVTSSSRGGEQASRDIYPDQYHSSDESSVPGPSGIQAQSVPEASMGEEVIPFREATALGVETPTCPPSTKAAVARAVLVATSPHLEPGPSSLKSQLVKDRLTPDEQTIKLEPSNANVPTESWEGSNQSYEDGGGGIAGSGSGAGVVPSTSDTLTMQLPLHAEMTEPSPLHDSSRSVGRRLSGSGRCDNRHPNVVLGSSGSFGSSGNVSGRGSARSGGSSEVGVGMIHQPPLRDPQGSSFSMDSEESHSRRKWKFGCVYCSKSFPTRWGLDRHTRTHTGEKPYTCHICHRNFNEQSNYQRHFRRHFSNN
ncbi:longitudinals lacking protein, isoforms H/M/V-like isoform X4 [Palaemon carinicauda]|uniref:longitudinals lacking protein, isoforms H/M/V-like isoform X4 n=1 Tax=Palaemon carinicauda TaxID=392227 RepID=UPI0035B60ADB